MDHWTVLSPDGRVLAVEEGQRRSKRGKDYVRGRSGCVEPAHRPGGEFTPHFGRGQDLASALSGNSSRGCSAQCCRPMWLVEARHYLLSLSSSAAATSRPMEVSFRPLTSESKYRKPPSDIPMLMKSTSAIANK